LKAVFDAGLKPEELPGLIAGSLMREVTECRTALSAEVALSRLMGMARLACPLGTSWDEQSRYVNALMGDMTVTAYEDGSEEALALLRVIAVLGGPTVSKRARAAAERLAAAGVPDRPWVRVLGRPTFVGAWR